MYQTSEVTTVQPGQIADYGRRIEALAPHLVRYAMVVVILWFGALKFTTYEAEAIQGLVSNSPFVGWLNAVFSVAAVSHLIGTVEIAAALLIAARAFSARLGAVGGLLAVGAFVTTSSFLFSTPGVSEMSAGGFPVLSVLPGQFLLKDLVLLAVSVWLLGKALKHWND